MELEKRKKQGKGAKRALGRQLCLTSPNRMSFLEQFCSGLCSQVDLVLCSLRLWSVFVSTAAKLWSSSCSRLPETFGQSGLPHFQVFFWDSRGDWQSRPWGFPCLRANQGCQWRSQGDPTWKLSVHVSSCDLFFANLTDCTGSIAVFSLPNIFR